MPQADSSATQLLYNAEATWGVDPSLPLKKARVTSADLRHNKITVESQEIRDDAQIPDVIEVGANGEGTTDFELSYGGASPVRGCIDDFIAGALRSAWVDTTITGSANLTFTSGTKTISGPTGFSALVVGQYIKVTGTASNNGYYEVATVPGDTSCTVVESLVTENNTSGTVAGSRLRNGNTRKSFLLEERYTDLTNVYLYYPGSMIDQMALNFVARQIVTGSFTWLMKEGKTATATRGNGADIAASTNDVMNATAHMGSLTEGGTALTTALMGINLNVNNNLRQKPAIANRTAIGIGMGRFRVTGEVNAYFEDKTLLDKFIAHTASKLHFRVFDGSGSTQSGNAFFFTMPRIKYAGRASGAPVRGVDTDIMATLPIQALRDPTLGYTLQIDRFAA